MNFFGTLHKSHGVPFFVNKSDQWMQQSGGNAPQKHHYFSSLQSFVTITHEFLKKACFENNILRPGIYVLFSIIMFLGTRASSTGLKYLDSERRSERWGCNGRCIRPWGSCTYSEPRIPDPTSAEEHPWINRVDQPRFERSLCLIFRTGNNFHSKDSAAVNIEGNFELRIST